MASVHIVCRRGLHVHPIEHPVYETGNWDFSTVEADQLVGGTIYLHESKGERSYFGGTVEAYRLADVPEKAHSQRIVFRIRSTANAKNVSWRGANHVRAWTGGIIG
jgi:hypothetical protein